MAWAQIDPTGEKPVLAIGAARQEWELCKQIPGCTIDKKDGIWRANLAWPVYAAFRTIWARQPIEISDELAEREARWMDEVRLRWHMRAALDCEDPELLETLLGMELPGFPQLDPVQRGAVEWLTRWRRDILGDPRGNGKTPPLIRSMQLLHITGELTPALVVCPDSAPLAWQEKLALWAPELRTVIIGGAAGARAKAVEKVATGEADVGIIIWNNLSSHTKLAPYPGQAYVRCDAHGGEDGKTIARCEVHEKDINAMRWGERGRGFRTVVADEAHRMAKADSKWTRAMWWCMHHAETVWPATGTLTPNDVGNLWPIQHGVDPAGYPVRSRWLALVALREYAFAGRGEKILDIRPDNRALYELTTWPMIRRIPKQIARAGQPGLGEPEYRYPQMPPAQMKLYRQIAETGLGDLEDSTLVADSSILAFTRMCQLSVASIEEYDAEDEAGFPVTRVRYKLPSHKISDLVDFMADVPKPGDDDVDEGITGQWIIAANSPAVIELAERRLNDPKVRITNTKIIGGMGYEAKHAAAEAFQRGDAQVIFINAAGGEAIDLQRADGIYWLQVTPSFVEREQKTGRGDRWGQTSEFRQVVALTPGTVEVRLWELSFDKEERHEGAIRDAQMLRWLMSVQPGEINNGRQRQWQ